MRSLLIAVTVLLVAAPAAAAQAVLDRAADSLRGSDPVYVAPDAEAGLDAAEEAALERRLPSGVRVAILPDSDREAGAVAAELANEVGRSGTYAVIVGDELVAGPSARARAAAAAAAEARSGEGSAAVLTQFVDELEQGNEPAGAGTGTWILLGLGAAGAGGLLLSRRRRRQEEAAAFAEVKDNARDDLVALGDDIRALDLDMEMPGVLPAAKADYDHAVGAYDRADQAWRLAERPQDLEKVGAELEEGRWAMTSARHRLDGKEPPERRSPCFFNPRHGPSDREVEWAPPHGEPRMVPACEADAIRVEEGEEPQAREVLVNGERVPYWNAGPMYAPFAGGFYGSGLLPGLMLGTLMGGMWDAPAAGADFGGGDFGGGDFGGGDFGGGFGGGDFGG
jgi:hypothetical protein